MKQRKASMTETAKLKNVIQKIFRITIEITTLLAEKNEEEDTAEEINKLLEEKRIVEEKFDKLIESCTNKLEITDYLLFENKKLHEKQKVLRKMLKNPSIQIEIEEKWSQWKELK